MKKTLLLAVSILAFTSVSAFAQGPYVAGDLGLAIFHDSDLHSPLDKKNTYTGEYNLNFGLDIAAGYIFTPNFRAEAEFGYRSAKLDKVTGPGGYKDTSPDSSLRIFSFMANGLYDVTQFKTPVIPYVGLGVGMLNGKSKSPSDSTSDTTFGYNLMVGVTYPIDKKLSVNGGYKLQGALSDFEKDGNKISYMSSNLLVGLRYKF